MDGSGFGEVITEKFPVTFIRAKEFVEFLFRIHASYQDSSSGVFCSAFLRQLLGIIVYFHHGLDDFAKLFCIEHVDSIAPWND